jgi:hypothetical protein
MRENLTQSQIENLAKASQLSAEARQRFAQGKYGEAINLELGALDLRVKALGHHGYPVAGSFADLAVMFLVNRNEVEAAQALRAAMVIYKEGIKAMHTAGYLGGKADLLCEIGDVHSSLGIYRPRTITSPLRLQPTAKSTTGKARPWHSSARKRSRSCYAVAQQRPCPPTVGLN